MKKPRARWPLLAAVLLVALGWFAWSALPGPAPEDEPTEFDVESQILPYFRARGPDSGESREVSGQPQRVVVRGWKLYVEFLDESGRRLHVDPLAIRSETWGEHPADKVLRLAGRHGLRISRIMAFSLRNKHLRGILFHRLPIEHRPGKVVTGVVAEVGITGSFLTIIEPVPEEWRGEGSDYLSPSFFLVIGRPDDRVQVDVLQAAGFDLEPKAFGASLVEQMWGIIGHCRGGGVHTSYWLADKFRELGLALDEEMRLASGWTRLRDETYLIASDAFLEPTVAKICQVGRDGELTELYRAPGRILCAAPHPADPNRWLISCEGHEQSDPRRRSLFEVNLRTAEWQVLDFPLAELYGTSARRSPDGKVLFVLRYGSVDEGGGIWAVDLTDPHYAAKRNLLAWDHIVSWLPVGLSAAPTQDDGTATGAFPVLITAKEVETGYDMTINRAVLRLEGMDSEIVEMRRLARTVGWSPRIIHVEEMKGGRYRCYIEATHDFTAYLEGDPAPIYVVELE